MVAEAQNQLRSEKLVIYDQWGIKPDIRRMVMSSGPIELIMPNLKAKRTVC